METQESVVITATIEKEEDRFVVRIDDLDLEGVGETLEAAQDDLIQIMRAWIETHDGTDSLSKVLANAGYPGVDEDTELQLEFAETAFSADGEGAWQRRQDPPRLRRSTGSSTRSKSPRRALATKRCALNW